MDPDRFDGLIRSFAHPASRRRALGALAGAFAVLGFEPASAAAKPRHAGHRHNAKPASDAGGRRRADADREQRPKANGKHRKGRHHKRCDAGLTSCRAKHHKHVCVDLQTGAAHCGQCDRVCAHDQTCQAGQCVGRGCVPQCGGKHCGDDGCGGFCGSCDGGKVCTQQGVCVCPNGSNDCGGVCQQCCSPADCPNAPCSEATCANGTCGLDPIAGCCTSKSDCDDQNPCTIDDCVGNVCQHNPAIAGTTCGTDQVCCGATCCGSGQNCQNGNCATPCTPTTCAALGRTCGTALDGCGGTLDCGACQAGQTCDASGQCAACTPLTSCPVGACGAYPDGCGGTLNCGACEAGACLTCGPDSTCISICGPCQACLPGTGSCVDLCSNGCVCPGSKVCDPTTGICVFGGGGGCFVAGTRVAMADGTSLPIEDVAVGDRVLGRGGRENRVLGLARPRLGDQFLYALNGSQPFVTAAHPFATEQGWTAIDPAATRREEPGLAVRRLAIGDRLLRLAAASVPVGAGGALGHDDLAIRLEPVALQALCGQTADPTTRLYDLLLNGDHTYFADELLVHNKTRQRHRQHRRR